MARRNTMMICSFCGKRQDQIQRLIAGPNGVYICDECVRLCDQILDDERATPSPPRGADAPKLRRPWWLVWQCLWETLVAPLTPWRRWRDPYKRKWVARSGLRLD